MQNEKKSIFVSILLVKILFVCLLAAPFLLPFFIGWYVSLSADLQSVYWPAMIIAYLCLVPAGIAIICMDRLLLNIRKKMVFVKKNADYLYTISWCAYAVCLPVSYTHLQAKQMRSRRWIVKRSGIPPGRYRMIRIRPIADI